MRSVYILFLLVACVMSSLLHAGDFQDAVQIREAYRKILASIWQLQARPDANSPEIALQINALQAEASLQDVRYAQQLRLLQSRFEQRKEILWKKILELKQKLEEGFHKLDNQTLFQFAGELSVSSQIMQNILLHEDESIYCITDPRNHDINHALLSILYVAHLIEPSLELSKEIENNKLDFEDNMLRRYFFESAHYNIALHAALALRGIVNLRQLPLQKYIELIENAKQENEPVRRAIAIIKKYWKQLLPAISFDKLPALNGVEPSQFERESRFFMRIQSPDLDEPIYLRADSIHGILDRISDLVFTYFVNPQSPYALRLIEMLRKNSPSAQTARSCPWDTWTLGMQADFYITHPEARTVQYPFKITKPHVFWEQLRIFLGQGPQAVNFQEIPSTLDNGRTAYAKFISEPVRNIRTWLVNLMMLDLLQEGILAARDFWERHPMQGGSFSHQQSGGGNKKLLEIKNAESVILLNWLRNYWPYVGDQIEFTDNPPPDDQTTVATLSFFDVIRDMLFKRALTTERFEPNFSVRPPMMNFLPPRCYPNELADIEAALRLPNPNPALVPIEAQICQSTYGVLRIHQARYLDGTVIQVEPQEVPHDGACGFTALGTTRAQFARAIQQPTQAVHDILAEFPPEQGLRWQQAIARNLHVGELELRLLAEILQARIFVFHEFEGQFVEHAAYGNPAHTVRRIAHIGRNGIRNHFIRLALPIIATPLMTLTHASASPTAAFSLKK